MKKRTYTLAMVALLTMATLTAASFTLGIETESNDFSFNAHQEEGLPSTSDLDLGIDLSLGIFSKSGVGMYLAGGYQLATTSTYLDSGLTISDRLTHGMSTGLGFAVKKEISRAADFMFSTGFGLRYNFNKKYLNLAYDIGIDFLFNIGSRGYVKLGAGYELEFLRAWKAGDEKIETKTYLDHNVLVPTIGFGIKF